MKNQKGITLVALIITIITLLLLAGVSINLILGENGILKQSEKAVVTNNNAKNEELRQMTIAEAAMNLNSFQYIDSDGNKAIIPNGFAVSQVEGENNINTGLVIIDKFGDEFVWIPVNNSAEYTKKLGTHNRRLRGNSKEPDNLQLSDSIAGDDIGLDNILGKSNEEQVVLEAKGFYVSRYEIGIKNRLSSVENSQSSEDWKLTNVVSQRNVEPIRNISYTQSIEIANNWKIGTNFQSGLITGTQWDVMCNFIGWSICDGDCSGWGNYCYTKSKEYEKINVSDDGSGNWVLHENWSRSQTGDTYKYVFPTGSFVTDATYNNSLTSRKNIYDIAGNLCEWTTEIPIKGNQYRVVRGGGANVDGILYNATSRYAGDQLEDSYYNAGFRTVLYINM